MKAICAWCNTELRPAESDAGINAPITHGICLRCASKLRPGQKKSYQSFLEQLEAPVVVIDQEPRICTANKRACVILGKCLPEIEERKPGDVIGCLHAKSPGGCGESIHCKSCTIRFAVLETFATGKNIVNIPAYPDVELSEEERSTSFLISTEKVGGVVLLRVNDIDKSKPPRTSAQDS